MMKHVVNTANIGRPSYIRGIMTASSWPHMQVASPLSIHAACCWHNYEALYIYKSTTQLQLLVNGVCASNKVITQCNPRMRDSSL
jgi:hypothetical protein